MTNEQKEAIEYLKESVLIYKNTIPRISNAIETALNLIKQQERKILDYDEIIARLEEENTKKDNLINEQLKENVRLQKELNEENKRCMILANNYKFKEQMIDEMAGYIAIIQECPNENCGANLDCENRCTVNDTIEEECWKMYFERKVKE